MSETAINPAVGALFKYYRKKQRNSLTGKPWTLQELSDELAQLVQQQPDEGPDSGLSASALSRLENGTLLPGRAKLKLLADVLQIPDQELKPLIDLGQERTRVNDAKERGRVREIENKLHKTPLDWLRLISYANINGDYSRALGLAEDALLALGAPQLDLPEKAVLQALINSKKSYAQYWLESEREQEEHLRRSQQWARHADQALAALTLADSVDRTLLQIETVRCFTTATQEAFDYRYIRHPQFQADELAVLESDYAELQTMFAQLDTAFRLDEPGLSPEQAQQLLELFLYFRREKDRLGFKRLEVREMHALREFMLQQLPWLADLASEPAALAVMAYEYLLQRPEQAGQMLGNLFLPAQAGLLFAPAADLQDQWQALSASMLATLEQHDQLERPSPNRGYQEAVMLYPLTAVRLGSFDRLADLAYFKLIYMQTNALTRPIWYYVRACCYALYYRQSQEAAHLEQSLRDWFHYCEGDLSSGQADLTKFAAVLEEAAFWSTWFPLISAPEPESPYQAWFLSNLQALMEQPRHRRWRQKIAQRLASAT